MKAFDNTMRRGQAAIGAATLAFSLFLSGGSVSAALPAVPIVTYPLNGISTSTSPLTIRGTADADMEIRVSGGASPAGATADASGNWTALVNLTADATNFLEFSARNGSTGEVGSSSSLTVIHVSATSTGGGSGGSGADVTAPAAPVVTFPTFPLSTSTSPFKLYGTAEADAAISVTGGWIPSTTTASASGNWSVWLNLFADTVHSIDVTATDAAGNVSATTTFSVTHVSTGSGTSTATSTPPTATSTPATTTPATTTPVTSPDENPSEGRRGGRSGDRVRGPAFTNFIPPMSPIALENIGLAPQVFVLGVTTAARESLLFTAYLTVGSRGAEVIALQTRLKEAGSFNGPITGYYGPLTKAAVRAFQRAHGVSMTGNVGPLTRAVLNS